MQRPSSLQLSAQTPAAKCAGQVESVTVQSINKENFYHISVYLSLFYALNYIGYELQVNCLFTAQTYINVLSK